MAKMLLWQREFSVGTRTIFSETLPIDFFLAAAKSEETGKTIREVLSVEQEHSLEAQTVDAR